MTGGSPILGNLLIARKRRFIELREFPAATMMMTPEGTVLGDFEVIRWYSMIFFPLLGQRRMAHGKRWMKINGIPKQPLYCSQGPLLVWWFSMMNSAMINCDDCFLGDDFVMSVTTMRKHPWGWCCSMKRACYRNNDEDVVPVCLVYFFFPHNVPIFFGWLIPLLYREITIW